MSFSLIQNVLWVAGGVVNAILVLVLLVKKRWREFSAFTTWITFLTAEMVLLYFVYRTGSAHLYSKVYWSCAIVDFLLQIGVVVEMARIVLRPTGTWVQDARRRFLFFGILGTLIAAGVALILHPAAPTSLDAWEIRGNLFTGLMVCEFFMAMMATANRLGLQWGDHVMGLGRGLVIWATIAVLVDGLHNLLGRYLWFNTLDNMRGTVWVAAVIYWTVIFWRPQKARLPLSADMQKYLVDLHEHVQYDLSRTESPIFPAK
jgi:hypothetical protein